MRLTWIVAATQLLHLSVAAIAIVTLPVDVAKGTLAVLALGTDVAVLAIVIVGTGRYARWHRR